MPKIIKKKENKFIKSFKTSKNIKKLEKLKDLGFQKEQSSQTDHTWIISDSSSKFPSFNLNTYGKLE